MRLIRTRSIESEHTARTNRRTARGAWSQIIFNNDAVFRAPLPWLEACNLTAPVAQAIFHNHTLWRTEIEVDAIRRIGCKVVNWTDPEYLLQIYDPPVLLYLRGDASRLKRRGSGWWGRGVRPFTGRTWRSG